MKQLIANIKAEESRSYPIIIDENCFEKAASFIAENFPKHKVGVITDKNVSSLYRVAFNKVLKHKRIHAEYYTLPAGEKNKTLRKIESILDFFLKKRFLRDSVLVALGGGVVGDMCGFVASALTRGVSFIQIPTTIVSQVDSSVGGKTGVDSRHGKNLIGAFYQPKAVFIHLSALKTLNEKEYMHGFAEIIKHALIRDKEMFEKLAVSQRQIRSRDMDFLEELIKQNIEIKKSVVENDEKEKSLRQILNFGHTIGHGIELVSKYKLGHGESIAYGIFYESVLSVKNGTLKAEDAEEIRRLLLSLELISEKGVGFSPAKIYSAMLKDKKNSGGEIRFVMLSSIGQSVEHEGKHSFTSAKDAVIRTLKTPIGYSLT